MESNFQKTSAVLDIYQIWGRSSKLVPFQFICEFVHI